MEKFDITFSKKNISLSLTGFLRPEKGSRSRTEILILINDS